MATLLDGATKLDISVGAVWRPKVGEHSVQVIRSRAERDKSWGEDADKARSRKQAQMRATTTVRRHCKEHGIDRLVTLTLAEETGLEDRQAVVARVQKLFRILRTRFPSLKYVYCLELHPGGHGYHVHAGINMWISKDLIADSWGHGWIDVRRITTKSRGNSHAQRAACARYLAKYACKSEDEGRMPGGHRYERSQSGPVTEFRIECDSWAGAVEWLRAKVRQPITWEWCSDDVEDGSWLGPRTLCLWE